MFDPEPLVRLVVAERLPEERLEAMREDEDLRVRFTVAERAPMALLPALLNDKDELVRAAAQARLSSSESRG
jgi:hypothetical protein